MKKSATGLLGLLLASSALAGPVDNFTAQVNSTISANGQGSITGGKLNAALMGVVPIFNSMGTWDSNGVFTVSGSGTALTGLTAAFVGAIKKAGDIGIGPLNGSVPTPRCLSIETFGGGTSTAPYTATSGQPVADNTAALVAARAGLPAMGGGCISFGMGTYPFTQQPIINLPNAPYDIFLAGSGEHSTKLLFASGISGPIINAQTGNSTIHTRDLSIITAGASPTTVGLTYKNTVAGGANAVSDVQHVAFLGADGGQVSQYWGVGFKSHQMWNVSVSDSAFYGAPVTPTTATTLYGGTGILVEGDAATQGYGTIYNLSRNIYNQLHRGFVYGSYIQGVSMDAQNMVGADRWISVEPSTTGVLAQLSVVNSQFAAATEAGFKADGAAIGQVMIANNVFFGQDNSTIWDASSGALQFSSIGNNYNCSRSAGASYGLKMGATNNGATSSKGDLFTSCTAAATLTSASSNVTIDSVYGTGPLANGVNVADAGTNNNQHAYQQLQTHQHVSFLGSTPTVTSGGGGTVSLDLYASDSAGTISASGTTTYVSVAFAKAYSNNPHCVVSSNSGTPFTGYAAATDHLAIFLTSATSPQFTYICSGP